MNNEAKASASAIELTREEILTVLKDLSFIEGILFQTPSCSVAFERIVYAIDMLTDKLK